MASQPVDLVSFKVKVFFCEECSPIQNSPVGLMLAKVAVATAKKRFPELESDSLMLTLLMGWAKQCGCTLTQEQFKDLVDTPALPKTPRIPKLDATKQQNCTQVSLGLD